MNKKNLLILAIVFALIAAVAAAALLLNPERTISADAPVLTTDEPTATATPDVTATPETTDVPAATEAPATTDVSAAADATEAPVPTTPVTDAYLVVSVRGIVYEPLPLAGEGSFTLRQDETTTNTVYVTPDSVRMEHSSCDNQDCVEQGTVTLDNIKTRVLSNMIICLPNEVVLELHTPETLKENFGWEV